MYQRTAIHDALDKGLRGNKKETDPAVSIRKRALYSLNRLLDFAVHVKKESKVFSDNRIKRRAEQAGVSDSGIQGMVEKRLRPKQMPPRRNINW